MNSCFFISEAQRLIRDIKDFQAERIISPLEEQTAEYNALNKRARELLSGLVNPTLVSAFQLVDLLLALDWPVDQRVLVKLGEAERWHQNAVQSLG